MEPFTLQWTHRWQAEIEVGYTSASQFEDVCHTGDLTTYCTPVRATYWLCQVRASRLAQEAQSPSSSCLQPVVQQRASSQGGQAARVHYCTLLHAFGVYAILYFVSGASTLHLVADTFVYRRLKWFESDTLEKQDPRTAHEQRRVAIHVT